LLVRVKVTDFWVGAVLDTLVVLASGVADWPPLRTALLTLLQPEKASASAKAINTRFTFFIKTFLIYRLMTYRHSGWVIVPF
jgi:hypothetical protein